MTKEQFEAGLKKLRDNCTARNEAYATIAPEMDDLTKEVDYQQVIYAIENVRYLSGGRPHPDTDLILVVLADLYFKATAGNKELITR